MRRTIFDQDHEAFRETCRTFVDRVLWPDQERHIANHGIGRKVWLELGRLELLGLNVPGSTGDPPCRVSRDRAGQRPGVLFKVFTSTRRPS